MIHPQSIGYVLGQFLLGLAATMLIPIGFGALDDSAGLAPLGYSFGITLACGSGACAAAVAAARRGLTGRKVEIVLDGGSLEIEWLPDNHVLMTGPVATSFAGTLDRSLLA